MVNHCTTNDLSFAAYMLLRGCALVSARKLGRSYKFVVDLKDEDENRIKVEWVNSECSKFDSKVRDLKKIMFSVDDNSGQRKKNFNGE